MSWEHNVEVIWNKELTEPELFVVNGEKMTPEEFNKNHSIVIAGEMLTAEPNESILPPIDLNEKLEKLERVYPDMKSMRSKFFTLLEIIRTRTELMLKNHC